MCFRMDQNDMMVWRRLAMVLHRRCIKVLSKKSVRSGYINESVCFWWSSFWIIKLFTYYGSAQFKFLSAEQAFSFADDVTEHCFLFVFVMRNGLQFVSICCVAFSHQRPVWCFRYPMWNYAGNRSHPISEFDESQAVYPRFCQYRHFKSNHNYNTISTSMNSLVLNHYQHSYRNLVH